MKYLYGTYSTYATDSLRLTQIPTTHLQTQQKTNSRSRRVNYRKPPTDIPLFMPELATPILSFSKNGDAIFFSFFYSLSSPLNAKYNTIRPRGPETNYTIISYKK